MITKLQELELLQALVPSTSAVVEDVALGREASRLPLKGTPPKKADGKAGSISVEEVEARQPPAILPCYDPLSPSLSSPGSKEQARLQVCLARLKLELEGKIQARQSELQLQHQLEIKRMEIEAEKAIQLCRLELEAQRMTRGSFVFTGQVRKPSNTSPPAAFDISINIVLVPMFCETEVDSYFSAFERIAKALQWPPEALALLLQCKLHGKAKEAMASFPVEESLEYDAVKAAILCAYKLVPEAYRQKFRCDKKTRTQSYIEFKREKGMLFDKWSAVCKACDFDYLCELIMSEDFKNCLPGRIVVYLSEQKVSKLSSAAVLADLTDETIFSPTPNEKTQQPLTRSSPPSTGNSKNEE